MAIETTYKCALSGEFVTKDELVTLRVGLRDWRPEDYVLVDVGRCCRDKTVADVLEHAESRPEWEVEH